MRRIYLYGIAAAMCCALTLWSAQQLMAQESQFTLPAHLDAHATSHEYKKQIAAARAGKCRSKAVDELIERLKNGLPALQQQLIADKRAAEAMQEWITAEESDGGPPDRIAALKKIMKEYYEFASRDANAIKQQQYDIEKLEGMPPCPERHEAAEPPPLAPPAQPPGPFGPLPPCGDVSAEINKLTEELTRLNKDEVGLEAALAKDTHDYKVADALYPHIGNATFWEEDPRVKSAHDAMDADQKRVDDNRAKIKTYKDRIAALYGVPPCPVPGAGTPPPADGPTPSIPGKDTSVPPVSPPQTPVAPPKPVAAKCHDCEALAAQINDIDEKIASWQRQDASMRKSNMNDPNIQAAIRDIANKIDALKAQRATLEAKKAECEKKQCKESGGFLHKLFSHVSIGVGVDVGGDRGHAAGEHSRGSDSPATDTPQPHD